MACKERGFAGASRAPAWAAEAATMRLLGRLCWRELLPVAGQTTSQSYGCAMTSLMASGAYSTQLLLAVRNFCSEGASTELRLQHTLVESPAVETAAAVEKLDKSLSSASSSSGSLTAVSTATAAHRLPIVALVGRANIGKSTLFNRLVGARDALVRDTPGSHMTRDWREGQARLFGARFNVVDTPG